MSVKTQQATIETSAATCTTKLHQVPFIVSNFKYEPNYKRSSQLNHQILSLQHSKRESQVLEAINLHDILFHIATARWQGLENDVDRY